MSDETTNESFKLDLDAKDFIEQAMQAKAAIASLGGVESLSELTEGILAAAPVIAVLGTAFFGVKTIFDEVFDAERIKQTNLEFETFAKSSGASAENLKKGLLAAAQGWAGEDEILQSANRAMVELGGNADKLPELMDAARKATALFGGTITENFDRLSEAVASGRTITLRQMGIQVDLNQALEKYASQIGVTVNELNQQGRAQAVLNAVLDQSKIAYAGVNTDITEATNSWVQFKSTLKDLGDMAALTWDKLFGPTVRTGLTWLANWMKDSKNALEATFGSGAEAAAAKADYFKDRVASLKEELQALETQASKDPYAKASYAASIKNVREELAKAEFQYHKLTKAKEEAEKQDASANRKPAAITQNTAPDTVDQQKRLQNEAAFQKQMLALRQQSISQRLSMESNADNAEALYRKQVELKQSEYDLQIKQVNAQRGISLTNQQADAEIAAIKKLKQEVVVDEQQIAQVRQQAVQNQLSSDTNAFRQMADASKLSASQSEDAWKKAGGVGGVAMTSFQNHASAAFKAIGSGSQSAAQAMGDAFMGVLGDMATKQGEFMMLDAFKFFPAIAFPEFAAGAALVAMGGALGGMSSGAGAPPSLGGSGGTAGSAATGSGNGVLNAPALQDQQQKNAVHITIQGHMFQTQETQNWLVNTIRNASDASDFTIASVN